MGTKVENPRLLRERDRADRPAVNAVVVRDFIRARTAAWRRTPLIRGGMPSAETTRPCVNGRIGRSCTGYG